MLRAPLSGNPLQKRTEVQWDIGAALGADDGADESMSPQAGFTSDALNLHPKQRVARDTRATEFLYHGASGAAGLRQRLPRHASLSVKADEQNRVDKKTPSRASKDCRSGGGDQPDDQTVGERARVSQQIG